MDRKRLIKLKSFVMRLFSGDDSLRKRLKELNVVYTERDFMSGFHGIEFNIDYPYGKGSREKINILRRLQDPTIPIEKA